jgi:hypothetical protein
LHLIVISFFKEDKIKYKGYTPSKEEYNKFLKEHNRNFYELGDIVTFLFLFCGPLIFLTLALIYPKSQPIVFDRKRRVIYTVVRNTLYIGQIPNYSIRKNTPLNFFAKADGLVMQVAGEIHFSLEIALAKSNNRSSYKIFRCGLIPNICKGYYDDALFDYIQDYNMEFLDEDMLALSENTFTALDPIRFFFDHSLCYYRDRTRSPRVLKKVDEFLKDNPNPQIQIISAPLMVER